MIVVKVILFTIVILIFGYIFGTTAQRRLKLTSMHYGISSNRARPMVIYMNTCAVRNRI
jgi:hypothetical protein